jgi:hypothetical protein
MGIRIVPELVVMATQGAAVIPRSYPGSIEVSVARLLVLTWTRMLQRWMMVKLQLMLKLASNHITVMFLEQRPWHQE